FMTSLFLSSKSSNRSCLDYSILPAVSRILLIERAASDIDTPSLHDALPITSAAIIDEQVRRIRDTVGDKRAICGLSGGVDSAVAAALVQRAVGNQLTCVFVDHGLLRQGEATQVETDFVAATGVDLKVVDAA